MYHWAEMGSAVDLEKSFTGMTRLNNIFHHFISLVESDTSSGEE